MLQSKDRLGGLKTGLCNVGGWGGHVCGLGAESSFSESLKYLLSSYYVPATVVGVGVQPWTNQRPCFIVWAITSAPLEGRTGTRLSVYWDSTSCDALPHSKLFQAKEG